MKIRATSRSLSASLGCLPSSRVALSQCVGCQYFPGLSKARSAFHSSRMNRHPERTLFELSNQRVRVEFAADCSAP